MTLREKFQEEPVVVYKDSYKLTNQSAELLEQIADDFAIGFTEWVLSSGIYHLIIRTQKINKELLEIYKEEQYGK